MPSLYKIIPDDFFSPLTFSMREHYSELLRIYYKKFMEFPVGVEKELLVSAFEEYFDSLPAESVLSAENAPDETDNIDIYYEKTTRGLASRSLRRLIKCGWMTEETLIDFTQIINITAYAKPFYEVIYNLTEGTSVEYESHIVTIYSSLCGDSVKDNGHLSVLSAHSETRKLVDSLKVLSQNIKTYIQELYDHSGEVKDLLHIHYNLYMNRIIDKAYNRMKTSDNLSRYRPRIIQSINNLSEDEGWINRFGRKLAEIKNRSEESGRKELLQMMNEIRDDLRSLDPIIEEIDDKNRKYSGISIEKLKSSLYSDESLESKIRTIIGTLSEGNIKAEYIKHGIFNFRYIDVKSLYSRRKRQAAEYVLKADEPDQFEIEMSEAELRLRIQKQLNPEKIKAFLDSRCTEKTVSAEVLAEDMDSFIRVLYAAVYAESRVFPYTVRWGEKDITAGKFKFKEHWFTKNEKQDQ